MAIESSYTCLITGANRGIGRGLVTYFLQRRRTTVIAGVRDPKSSTAQSLLQLPAAEGSRVVIIQTDNNSEATTKAGIESLPSSHGIRHLDAVIANAGQGQSSIQPMVDADLDEFRQMVDTNGLGVLVLFRQALPLMRRAPRTPKFAYISSALGNIALAKMHKDFLVGPMAASKALGHFVTLRLSLEVTDVLTFMLDPGAVSTEAYKTLQDAHDPEPHVLTPDESARMMGKVFEQATMETHHGRYLNYDGKKL